MKVLWSVMYRSEFDQLVDHFPDRGLLVRVVENDVMEVWQSAVSAGDVCEEAVSECALTTELGFSPCGVQLTVIDETVEILDVQRSAEKRPARGFDASLLNRYPFWSELDDAAVAIWDLLGIELQEVGRDQHAAIPNGDQRPVKSADLRDDLLVILWVLKSVGEPGLSDGLLRLVLEILRDDLQDIGVDVEQGLDDSIHGERGVEGVRWVLVSVFGGNTWFLYTSVQRDGRGQG
jgi:hypothetical protein